MKTLRLLCLTAVLSSASALPVRAGDIECGIQNAPPCIQQPTEPTEGEGAADEAGDVVVDVLAALLNGLLTVL